MQDFKIAPEEMERIITSIKIITESQDFDKWVKEIESEGLLTLVGSFKAWERQKGTIETQAALIESLRARVKQLEGLQSHLVAENTGLRQAVTQLKEEFGIDH